MKHARPRSQPFASNSAFEPLESRQLMAAGDLDPTFGAGGKLVSQAVGFPVADVAVQRDGKVVAVGRLADDFAVARLNADGTVDRPFGGNNRGKIRADFGGNRGDFATAVAIQPDGKIVVVGRRDHASDAAFNDQGSFAVARFNADGTLDKTFDDNGLLTIDFEGWGQNRADAVAVQPDGKILVAGYADTGGYWAFGDPRDDFAIARLLPNGGLDRTFGLPTSGTLNGSNRRTGKRTIGLGGNDDRAYALAVAPDGKILLGGIARGRFAVLRLDKNGSPDKSFTDGISGDGTFNNLYGAGATVRDLHVQPDGSVFAVGGFEGNFATVRIKPSGSLDASFGDGDGHVETDFAGGNDEAKHVRVTREGILVAGGSGGKFAMARYRVNGTPDQTFGTGGEVTTALGGNEAILTTTMTSDGKLLAYGRAGGVARYIAAVPRVNVSSLDRNASESGDNASVIVTRDLRLSFPTRVYLDLGGTAARGADYTTGLSIVHSSNSAGSARLVGGDVAIGQRAYVDIPANETYVVVPIKVTDDTLRESAETVRVTVAANANYAVGPDSASLITIADNDNVIFSAASQGTPRQGIGAGLFSDARIDELP